MADVPFIGLLRFDHERNGIDPETGHHYDDTKRYIDQLPLSAADKAKIFEGNARRVYRL